jgi:hypothetical protein
MRRPRLTKREALQAQINDQQDWINSRGGSLAGYIERYGDPSEGGEYFGDGGAAIYRADFDALLKLKQQLAGLR